MRLASSLVLILVLCPLGDSQATEVNLDPTFGTFGQVIVDVLPATDAAQDVLVQSDGAIVAAGFADEEVALVRVTAAGALDGTFGTGGIVTTDVNGGAANVVAQQADGKLVIAGYADNVSPNTNVLVARYEADGSLDSSFGGTGIVKTDVGPGFDLADGLAIQSDGKVVVAGFSYQSGAAAIVVLRYLTDGTLDGSFGTGGVVVTVLPSGYSLAHGVTIQSDDKIVVAGQVSVVTGNDAFVVLRYETDGTLDSGFGTGGAVTTDFAFDTDIANGVAVLPDGRIVAGGHHGSRFAAARYLADGTPDGTFGTGGRAVLDLVPGFDLGFDMVVQPDGRIVLAGYAQPFFGAERQDLAVVRLDTAGAPDATFAPGGGAVLVLGADSSVGVGLARQSDGKLVIAGWSVGAGDTLAFLIARLGGTCGDGTVDAGEQCDDANTNGLDCCSPGCGLVPAGDPCEFDGNICTSDVCDGAGTCTLGGPAVVCRAPTALGKARLSIVDSGDDTRDRLDWKWTKGGSVSPPEFGFPSLVTDFTLCIFAGPGSAPPLVYQGDIPAGPNWYPASSYTRFRYKDPSGANDGFVKGLLQEGFPSGDAKASLKAKGPNVGPPPLELATPVTAQLRGNNGSCFGATFAAPSSNTSSRFKAKGQ